MEWLSLEAPLSVFQYKLEEQEWSTGNHIDNNDHQTATSAKQHDILLKNSGSVILHLVKTLLSGKKACVLPVTLSSPYTFFIMVIYYWIFSVIVVEGQGLHNALRDILSLYPPCDKDVPNKDLLM